MTDSKTGDGKDRCDWERREERKLCMVYNTIKRGEEEKEDAVFRQPLLSYSERWSIMIKVR